MSIWNIFMENFFFVHVRVFIFSQLFFLSFFCFFASLAEIVMNNFAFNCLGSQQQRCRGAALRWWHRHKIWFGIWFGSSMCKLLWLFLGGCLAWLWLWLGSVPRLRFGRIWLGSVCWQVDAPGAQAEASPHSANSTGGLRLKICVRVKIFSKLQ